MFSILFCVERKTISIKLAEICPFVNQLRQQQVIRIKTDFCHATNQFNCAKQSVIAFLGLQNSRESCKTPTKCGI